ncbi:hypothetical protein Q1695_016256 [Nippostrongylus brasiliensis]|nr:hypothetical protein Q1695_016256 [Nippostrongylus brasiliensis]
MARILRVIVYISLVSAYPSEQPDQQNTDHSSGVYQRYSVTQNRSTITIFDYYLSLIDDYKDFFPKHSQELLDNISRLLNITYHESPWIFRWLFPDVDLSRPYDQ